jgi:hypothetical protein
VQQDNFLTKRDLPPHRHLVIIFTSSSLFVFLFLLFSFFLHIVRELCSSNIPMLLMSNERILVLLLQNKSIKVKLGNTLDFVSISRIGKKYSAQCWHGEYFQSLFSRLSFSLCWRRLRDREVFLFSFHTKGVSFKFGMDFRSSLIRRASVFLVRNWQEPNYLPAATTFATVDSLAIFGRIGQGFSFLF